MGGGDSALYGTESATYYLRNGVLNLNVALPLALAAPLLPALWAFSKTGASFCRSPFPKSSIKTVYLPWGVLTHEAKHICAESSSREEFTFLRQLGCFHCHKDFYSLAAQKDRHVKALPKNCLHAVTFLSQG